MTDDFETRLRNELRDSEARLDPSTRSRLAAARNRALDAAPEGEAPGQRWRWAPLGAALAIAALAVFIYRPDGGPAIAPEAGDIEPLLLATAEPEDLAEHEIELYEDLDFYEWLAMEASTG